MSKHFVCHLVGSKLQKGSVFKFPFKSKQILQMNAQTELRNIFLEFLVLYKHFVCHLVGSNPQGDVQTVQMVNAVQNPKWKRRERLFSLHLVGWNSQGEI